MLNPSYLAMFRLAPRFQMFVTDDLRWPIKRTLYLFHVSEFDPAALPNIDRPVLEYLFFQLGAFISAFTAFHEVTNFVFQV